MDIVSLSSESRPLWENFCRVQSGAWFWQSPAFLDYQAAYRPDRKTAALHFLIVRNREAIAICPLAVETETDGSLVGTFGGDSIPSPAVADSLAPADRDRVWKKVLEEAERRLKDAGALKWAVRFPAFTADVLASSIAPVNPLSRHGFLDLSIQTQMLDLRAGEAAVWTGFRKSYHSLIRRTEEAFAMRVLDKDSVTPETFDAYRVLHAKAAGRVTRPIETFQMMHEWVRSGSAILLQALKGDIVAGCALVIIHRDGAYYASACNDPEIDAEWPLGHYLQWKIIQALKARGTAFYELGWQTNSAQFSYIPTPSERNIAHFKRGMGGTTVPVFQSVRYFDAALAEKEVSLRSERLVAALKADLTPAPAATPASS